MGQPQQQPPQQRPPQQPRPAEQQPPDFSALKAYLNLSEAQIRQMQAAHEKAAKDAEDKTRTLVPQIEEKRRALADLLDKDNPDATAVGKGMLEVRGLERQLRSAHEAVRDAGINLMTPEQKAKFKAIQDAAMLPQATRDAQRLGLVPGPPPAQGPNPGTGPNGPRPGMQWQPAPGPGPNPARRQPDPARQGDPEGNR